MAEIKWKSPNAKTIAADRTDDNGVFEYFVDGVVEWKLLGTTIYSQPKKFNGTALTK